MHREAERERGEDQEHGAADVTVNEQEGEGHGAPVGRGSRGLRHRNARLERRAPVEERAAFRDLMVQDQRRPIPKQLL